MIDTNLYILQSEALKMEFEVLLKKNVELVEEFNRLKDDLNMEFADLLNKNSEIVEEYNRFRNDYFTIKDIITFDPLLKNSKLPFG